MKCDQRIRFGHAGSSKPRATCFSRRDSGFERLRSTDKLRLECLLNLASCKLRTRQYEEVIDSCGQVRARIWYCCV